MQSRRRRRAGLILSALSVVILLLSVIGSYAFFIYVFDLAVAQLPYPRNPEWVAAVANLALFAPVAFLIPGLMISSSLWAAGQVVNGVGRIRAGVCAVEGDPAYLRRDAPGRIGGTAAY
jgi:hypothetical protein